jgi:hypothetical protein
MVGYAPDIGFQHLTEPLGKHRRDGRAHLAGEKRPFIPQHLGAGIENGATFIWDMVKNLMPVTIRSADPSP